MGMYYKRFKEGSLHPAPNFKTDSPLFFINFNKLNLKP